MSLRLFSLLLILWVSPSYAARALSVSTTWMEHRCAAGGCWLRCNFANIGSAKQTVTVTPISISSPPAQGSYVPDVGTPISFVLFPRPGTTSSPSFYVIQFTGPGSATPIPQQLDISVAEANGAMTASCMYEAYWMLNGTYASFAENAAPILINGGKPF